MVYAVIGSGGKTTRIHQMAREFRNEGKKVFVTTSTHMYIEEDTLLTDDASIIIEQLEREGYVMAGLKEGKKIKSLPEDVYERVCEHADIVLVEADGSRGLPLKYPNDTEPAICRNVDKILLVCGLQAIGKQLKDTAFRLNLVLDCLGVSEDTIVAPEHIQKLIRKGYMERMGKNYAEKEMIINPVGDGSLYQRALSGLLQADFDVNLLKREWFEQKPYLFICGGGHVAKELAEFAARLDFRICVMDDREEFADKTRFSMADEVICDDFDHLWKYLREGSFYVIVTRGHKADFDCLKQIIKTNYRYLGMIGSRVKVEKIMQQMAGVLREEQLPAELLKTIHSPIGLSIGAVTPGEIAISILAEMIQAKNQESQASASDELLATKESGVLCIIVEKRGSSPRGVGSMMLVGKDMVIDTIGGGTVEAAVIEDAKKTEKAIIREYHLNNKESERLGMICGGSNQVLFIPV